ncbi:hypothetical protein CLV72_105269 [Allonocardiopsis opalescens]|uniref:Uncharacterized protein n=2 Tax=Allonocardiopsis opalescens TaxID=1144618 RepID=A0A2T0Q288_9ACTN|nr:hypothetical protein CLV72_105269 [Allonocardiopsis opalescens]
MSVATVVAAVAAFASLRYVDATFRMQQEQFWMQQEQHEEYRHDRERRFINMVSTSFDLRASPFDDEAVRIDNTGSVPLTVQLAYTVSDAEVEDRPTHYGRFWEEFEAGRLLSPMRFDLETSMAGCMSVTMPFPEYPDLNRMFDVAGREIELDFVGIFVTDPAGIIWFRDNSGQSFQVIGPSPDLTIVEPVDLSHAGRAVEQAGIIPSGGATVTNQDNRDSVGCSPPS